MKRIFALLLTFTCFFFPSLAQFPTSLAESLQEQLDNSVGSGLHGVSACVTLADGSEWHGTAGVNGVGNPITDTTLFHSASLTKSHVAACAMQLVEEGSLDLDAAWTTYVTEPLAVDDAITVGQLMTHTAGIADYLEVSGSAGLILDEPTYSWTPEAIFEDAISATPSFSPGTDFQYSNSNYVLLGMIIASVEGQPLAQSLRERIWEPIGLNHTYFGGFETLAGSEAGVWWNFGNGFNDYSDIDQTSMLSFAYAAGNLVSTPNDQARFMDALLSGELVDPASLTTMQTWTSESFGSWTAGYGYGLHHASGVSGANVIGHDGYYSNMTSTYKHLDLGFTIATATNTNGPWNALFVSLYNEVLDAAVNSVDENTSVPVIWPGPNPTNGKIRIVGMEFDQVVWASDMAGNVQLLRAESDSELDLSALSPGVYILRLEGDQGLRQFRVILTD